MLKEIVEMIKFKKILPSHPDTPICMYSPLEANSATDSVQHTHSLTQLNSLVQAQLIQFQISTRDIYEQLHHHRYTLTFFPYLIRKFLFGLKDTIHVYTPLYMYINVHTCVYQHNECSNKANHYYTCTYIHVH